MLLTSLDVIGFSVVSLNLIGASNDEFYSNVNIEEAITTRLPEYNFKQIDNSLQFKNKFPEMFN